MRQMTAGPPRTPELTEPTLLPRRPQSDKIPSPGGENHQVRMPTVLALDPEPGHTGLMTGGLLAAHQSRRSPILAG